MTVVKGELPDLFAFEGGNRVRTAADWRRRRAELYGLLCELEYGPLPPTPSAVHAELLYRGQTKLIPGATFSTYRLDISGGAEPFWFTVQLLQPAGDGPHPVVINGDGCWTYVTEAVSAEVLGRGYALATFNRTELAPDAYHSRRDTGLYRIYPEVGFAALGAWAWGYHRVVDLLLTLDGVNAEQIAVAGHSRGGKCVLLAGATDERIALTAPNDSGAGGAGCCRYLGEGSETIGDLVRAVPYWFGPRFGEFVDREQELPVDQHALKAMVAPRALLSTEALGDLWANPTGTWQTHQAAREVYRFLGAEERIGIWYREGEHNHGLVDWQAMLDFADWQLRGVTPHTDYAAGPFGELPSAFSWRAPAG